MNFKNKDLSTAISGVGLFRRRKECGEKKSTRDWVEKGYREKETNPGVL